jgi:hypothetical protein
MTIVARLGGTRSSHHWQEMPGNWDRLNTRLLFASANQWGIPDLPVASVIPTGLVSYNDRRAVDAAPPGAAIHFFLDDYRFEVVWTRPERGLNRPVRVGMALTPDFSLWTEMPWAMQVWQVYRARWCGMWMIQHGVSVIPTVGWSDPRSYDFAFAGIPVGSVVAVSTVGISGEPAEELFLSGMREMLARVQPPTVLVYGKQKFDLPTGTDYRWYDSRRVVSNGR